MTKIVESIKFTGTNLNDIFKLDVVRDIVKREDDVMVFLKGEYTCGRSFMRNGDYLCKLSNGMWQVFGQEAYMIELKEIRV